MNHPHFKWLTPLFLFGIFTIPTDARSQDLPDSSPKGWRNNFADSSTDGIVGVDTEVMHGGKASGFLYRAMAISNGKVNLSQTILADAYRGKRVRMTVYAKSKEVNSAFFSMIVYGSEYGLAGANTFKNRIVETIDWTAFHITLDIPVESETIVFGAIVMDNGKLWVDDFSLEIVDQTVPSDDMKPKTTAGQPEQKFKKRDNVPNAKAMNLDFEDK